MRSLFRHILFGALLVLCLSITSYARGRLQGIVGQGGLVAVTSGVNSTTTHIKTFPGSTVTIYIAGTTTLAPLFADNAGTTKANPFTASSSDASWFAYLSNGRYDVKFSGTGITNAYTVSDFMAFDPNDHWFEILNYGATCNGTTDDAASVQSAIDAAVTATHANVYVPARCQLKINSKLQLNGGISVIFGTDQPEGYSYSAASARLIWGGSSGGTMLELIGSSGCEVRGLRFDMGTAARAINIDSGGSVTSTSDIVRGAQIVKSSSSATTIGVAIAQVSTANNERMQIYNSACFFSSNAATSTTAGSCFKIGASGAGGANALNILFVNPYWYGPSYGIDSIAGSFTSINGQSNYATVDYSVVGGSATIIEHRTESQRQFVKSNGSAVIINGGFVGNGSWNASYPLIYAEGSSYIQITGEVRSSVQSLIVGLDADVSSNSATNGVGLPNLINNFSNFTQGVAGFIPRAGGLVGLYLGGTNGTSLQMKGNTFANLAFMYSTTLSTSGNGTLVYCTDCTYGSNPCTSGSTGAFAKRVNGAWRCD